MIGESSECQPCHVSQSPFLGLAENTVGVRSELLAPAPGGSKAASSLERAKNEVSAS